MPPPNKPSANLEGALKLFQDSAGRTLESIAAGTEGIISGVLEKVKGLDRSKVSEAIDNLGKSSEVVAAGGKLIRQGLEKLKAVLDALSKLFGTEMLAHVKAEVRKVWEKFSGDQSLVRIMIGVPIAHKRVRDLAAINGLEIPFLDGVSRELALLEDKYQGKRKILNGLLAAVVLATGILAALKMAGLWAVAPWVVLVEGGVYAALMGSALLVGLNYTGSRPLLGWIRGVCEIVRDPRPPQAAQ